MSVFSLPITRNRLLAALSPEDLALLIPLLKERPLEQQATLQDAERPVETVYFPQSGMFR